MSENYVIGNFIKGKHQHWYNIHNIKELYISETRKNYIYNIKFKGFDDQDVTIDSFYTENEAQ